MIAFNHILLFGVGLIGGSLSLALRKSGYTGKITGIDRNEASLARARELGLIDEMARSTADAVGEADLILLAAPVAQTAPLLASIRPWLREDVLITDVGSTKSDVVAAAYRELGDRVGCFIPAHPIAGREVNGPDAAIDDLFAGKKLVITPLPENTGKDIEKVAMMWMQCDAVIHFLSPQDHDNVFAMVSHLPHLLSYALVDQVARHPNAGLMFQYAASGFRDFTRIAGSSPEMWRDISIANKTQLLQELDSYLAELELLRGMLASDDAAGVEAVYANAQQARLNWITTIEAAEKQGGTS
ncbi:prephenate dehydrogenase/arogenate dehydrogenase family protein [Oxalobacter sp. OttesenSCG-928-P03]|nr:prephenate dehydrogenase/arogenate dehydrogenase family protein [Oxalobacter sp. OttesenSCG-928-P03]